MQRLSAIAALMLFTAATPTPSLSATICTEIGGFKCYCSGLGCRKFCKDIIILGGGGGSSAPATTIGALTAAPQPALENAGIFRGAVRVDAPGFGGRASAAAVMGPSAEVDAGRGRLFVARPGGAPREVGPVRLDAVTVSGGGASMTKANLRDSFNPARVTLD